MDELKKVFDASRKYRKHTIQQAASTMGDDGYSKTTLDRFFNNTLDYPDNVNTEVKKYIYQTGLIKSIQDLGLDPNQPIGKLKTSN